MSIWKQWQAISASGAWLFERIIIADDSDSLATALSLAAYSYR